MIRTLTTGSLLLAMVGSSLGCQFIARSPEQYAADTTALLEKYNGEMKACYDKVLKDDPSAEGTVYVHFRVDKETGDLGMQSVRAKKSTAPRAVQQCVHYVLGGVRADQLENLGTDDVEVRGSTGADLKLEPPDQRDGLATFIYEMKVAPQSSTDDS